MKRFLWGVAMMGALLISSAQAASNPGSGLPRDNATAYGESLSENRIQESSGMFARCAHVLCDTLFMYSEPSAVSPVVATLAYDQEIEIVEETGEWARVRHSTGTGVLEGYVRRDYVQAAMPYFIAMHPTPVHAAPDPSAPKLSMLDTYDSLKIVSELDGFYIVSLSGAVGFVEKEL